MVNSSIQQIFPEDRHSKKQLGRPREDPDGYKDDKSFDAKDLFGATRRKRYYGSPQSGYGQHTSQISSRQAQVGAVLIPVVFSQLRTAPLAV